MGKATNARQNGARAPRRRPGQARTTPAAPPEALPPFNGGRPRVEMTAEDLRQVEVLAGYGLTRPAIARVLGVSVRTFERRLTDDPELVAALDRGLAVAEAQVGEALFVLAIGDSRVEEVELTDAQGRTVKRKVRSYKRLPDLQAVKWWEQTRAGRREVVRQETVSLDDEAGMTDEEVAQEVRNIISLGAERLRRQQAANGGAR